MARVIRRATLLIGILLGAANAQDFYAEQETLTVETTVGGATNADLGTPAVAAAIRTLVAASFNRSESKVLVRVATGTTKVIAIVTFPRGAAAAARDDVDAAALADDIEAALDISGATVPVPTVGRDIEVVLGAYGPITSYDKNFLATLIAFDLDFRANYDAEVQAKIGDPMVQIENLNPRLRLRLQVGNSHSDTALGVQTALDFWYEQNGMQNIMGLIGGYHSAISMPVASIGMALKKAQVSFGSTSSQLSKKARYGYFFRTIPEDSIQAAALWQWMETFKVPKVLSLYANDASYAYGLNEGVVAYAVEAGKFWKIQSVPVELPIYDKGVCTTESSLEAASTAKRSGFKFMMALFVKADWGCFADQAIAVGLHGEGVTGYQWIGSEAMSAQLPAGFMQFQPQNQDPKMWPRFSDLWSRLNESDITGVASQDYYKVSTWHAPWLSDQVDWTFDPGAPDPSLEGPFAFDAGYAFMYAFNKLLETSTLEEIVASGNESLLLEQLRLTDFGGLSGTVTFNDKQDRVGDYRLMNMRNCTWDAVERGCLRDGTLKPVQVGTFYGATDALALTQDLAWAPSVDLCPDGTFDCVPCPSDQVFVDSIGTCVCKAGYSIVDGACVECGAGLFSVAPGSNECDECAPGRFAADLGSTECARCPVGTYSSAAASGTCTVCPDTFTTAGEGNEGPDDCLCGVGSRPGSSGVCEDCGDRDDTGLVCPGGGVVLVNEGFYAADSSLSVFKCYGSNPAVRCQGGEPGPGCCADGRQGIACSECLEGYKEAGDGSCIPCGEGGSNAGAFVFFCVILVAGLVVLYLVVSRRNGKSNSHSLLMIELVASMAVVVLQQLSLVGMFEQVSWNDPMDTLLGSLQLLAFDLDVLSLNCLARLSPIARFISSNMVFVVCVAVLGAVHLAFVAVFHRGSFMQRQPWFTACIGTVFSIFYISVVSSVLEPLQCLQNPNGALTNRQYPSVICWDSEEHTTMVIIAIAVLIIPLAYLARCCQVVWCYPAAIDDGRVDYLISYSFLFSRYKPDVYWYSLVQLFRSLLLAVLPIVPNVAFQLLGMLVVLAVQLLVTAILLPWRIQISNYVELFFTVVMLFVLAAGGLYVDVDPDAHLSWACFSLLAVTFLSLPPLFLLCLYKYMRNLHRKQFEYFLCHHKAGAGAFARLMKISLQRKDITVFVDCDNLTDLDCLFDQVGSLTRTLVMVCSQELLSRVWCVGEICTAKAKGLDIVKLRLPCYGEPSDSFIEGLSENVRDMHVLTSRGITVAAAQEALQWTQWQRAIEVPWNFHSHEVRGLVRDIRRGDNAPRASTKRSASGVLSLGKIGELAIAKTHSHASPAKTGEVAMGHTVTQHEHEDHAASTTVFVRDERNPEATAGAMVLAHMLRQHFHDSPGDMPRVPEVGHELPDTTRTVILICTRGALEQEMIHQVLKRAMDMHTKCLPVVTEEGFQFPTSSFSDDHRELAARVVGPDASPDDLLDYIRGIFKTIALRFLASMASDAALGTEADQVARRLHALRDGRASLESSGSSRVVGGRSTSGSKDAARRLTAKERRLLRSAFRGWAGALAGRGGPAPDDGADAEPCLQEPGEASSLARTPESSEVGADQAEWRYPAVFDAGRVDEGQGHESGDVSV